MKTNERHTTASHKVDGSIQEIHRNRDMVITEKLLSIDCEGRYSTVFLKRGKNWVAIEDVKERVKINEMNDIVCYVIDRMVKEIAAQTDDIANENYKRPDKINKIYIKWFRKIEIKTNNQKYNQTIYVEDEYTYGNHDAEENTLP